MRKSLLLLMSLVMLFSCNSSGDGGKHKAESTGSPYEIFVVAGDSVGRSPAMDSLKAIFNQNMPMIYPNEPLASLVTVRPEQLTGTLKRHRNIVYMRAGSGIDSSSVNATFDVNSSPQMVVYVDGRNVDSLGAVLGRKKRSLQKLIDEVEQERFVVRMNKYPQPNLADSVLKKFDVKMTFPRGYKLRNQLPDFMWISYEMPVASQGVIIYTYPYDSTTKMSLESILEKRNAFGALIPGSAEGSYMTTSTSAFMPETKVVTINGRKWAETRGFWELYGDYMGGPFVSYTTIDKERGRVFCIDEYVYSPKGNYRNYVRMLESIVKTVSFDTTHPVDSLQ